MLRNLGKNINNIINPRIRSIVLDYHKDPQYFTTTPLNSQNTTPPLINKQFYYNGIVYPIVGFNARAILSITVIVEDISDRFYWSKHEIKPYGLGGLTNENWCLRRANSAISSFPNSASTLVINGFCLYCSISKTKLELKIIRPFSIANNREYSEAQGFAFSQIRSIEIQYVENHPDIYAYID